LSVAGQRRCVSTPTDRWAGAENRGVAACRAVSLSTASETRLAGALLETEEPDRNRLRPVVAADERNPEQASST
jgi:hypothetical protein